MSVLDVFGQNLRNLTALRGSQTSVANDLDIGRVQFQRYLRSESFPKPNLLKRICDYFGVDARILTDLLTAEQLHLIETGRQGVAVMSPENSTVNDALRYCLPDQNYFRPSPELPDGIYQVWRGSLARSDMAYRLLIRIHTIGDARVIRGYDHSCIYPSGSDKSGRAREFRGTLLKQMVGYTALYFHREPSRIISMEYLEPLDFGYTPAVRGYSAIARGPIQGISRISRCLIFKLSGNLRDAIRAGRANPYVDWNDVPETILPYIKPGNESF